MTAIMRAFTHQAVATEEPITTMTSRILKNREVASSLDLLSAWIEAQMAYSGQPGLSIGIVHDQKLLWTRGFGYADVQAEKPATAETIYRIASITKLFTTTAIMQLRDEGKLQLDDPVNKHLPWFAVQNRFADAPVITIRHLLTHTSGLPRESAFPLLGGSGVSNHRADSGGAAGSGSERAH